MIFFIVGRGRSGTTLLASLLNTHEQVVIPPEALFVMTLYSKYSQRYRWPKKLKEKFFDDLWVEKWLDKWSLDKDKLYDCILQTAENTTFSDLCKIVYNEYAGSKKIKKNILIGDKNPQYSLFVNELHQVFPEAKFIHIVRDFRDNIVSFKNVRFDLNSTIALAYRWRRYNKEINKLKERIPHKFYTLRYEDLINEPEQKLNELCGFLSIEYTPQMLDFYKFQVGRFPKFHRKLKKPIDANNKNKWKLKMKKDEVEIVNFICRKSGELLGYKAPIMRNKFILFFKSLFGIILGWFSIVFEKIFFFLPLPISARISDSYRNMVHQSKDYYKLFVK